jgi:hypothetical protein
VRGLRRRFRIHCGRTALLPRQEFQKRTQAVQKLQDQTARCAGRRVCQNRNHDNLLAVRPGNHGALQTHTGPSRVLPGVLPQPKGHVRRGGGSGRGLIQHPQPRFWRARFFAAQPGLTTWRARPSASASGGTFSVIVEPQFCVASPHRSDAGRPPSQKGLAFVLSYSLT